MPTEKALETSQLAAQLLDTVKAITAQLQPGQLAARRITLDSRLDVDLGLDSLTRLELVDRLEKRFAVHLPARIVSDAETPRDLLQALLAGSRDNAPLRQLGATPVESLAVDQLSVPERASTLLDVVDWHVERQADHRHIRLFDDDTDEQSSPRVITYGELQRRAYGIATDLQQRGLTLGDSVALMLPTCEDYFFSFFGVLYAGGIPVPIYPPARLTQLADHMQRQALILDNAQCRFLITVAQAKPLARLLKSQVQSLRDVLTPHEMQIRGSYTRPPVTGDDVAFLQYTSGSTGNPKGVILSHRNLLSNIRADGAGIEADSHDVFVSWLPLYHDMGLIGAWLGSLYFGAQLIIMSPLGFLARPVRWLRLLHRYAGTLSAAPNFAYQLCLSRIDEQELDGLDLSHWRIAMNGAEAISPDTIERFSERFSAYGFRQQAMFPVYGLAECSVGLAFPRLHRPPHIDRIERDALSQHGLAQPAGDDATALRFVGCGHALQEHQIRIVDGVGQPLPDRHQGQLQFRGPSTTRGYFRNPEASAKLFDGDWLRSGDLAYLVDGEVFITGRVKDVIIRGGRNIYPHELEEAVAQVPGVRKGRVAVFASNDPLHQTERLVILAETRSRDDVERASMRQQINTIASELTLTPADDIVLAAPGSVLKTSSGKIRRAACRELYEQNAIGPQGQSLWLQLARMQLRAAPQQLRGVGRRLAGTAYALYTRVLFHVLAAWVTLGVLLLPKPAWRWAQLGHTARALARLSGTPLSVTGTDRLPAAMQACIFVSNHASYLDSYAIAALLPRRFRFIAKAELTREWLPRTFLQRIDTLFVERHDLGEGIANSEMLTDAAKQGDSLLFFPEGTFTRIAGLRPFRMGAFVTAVASDLPIVPLTLVGTRAILPANSRMPRRGSIQMHIGEPLYPGAMRHAQDSDWDLAVRLRAQARDAILAQVGEPDMAHEPAFPPPRD